MRLLLIVTVVSRIEDDKETLHSGGQELGEFVSTTHNTYVNPGSVAQFDFQQESGTS